MVGWKSLTDPGLMIFFKPGLVGLPEGNPPAGTGKPEMRGYIGNQ